MNGKILAERLSGVDWYLSHGPGLMETIKTFAWLRLLIGRKHVAWVCVRLLWARVADGAAIGACSILSCLSALRP